MSALERHLHRVIAHEGSITVARYMLEALVHPQHGYYMSRDPLGAAGDFTTAPEVSQMFGELIGLWCGHCWEQMGRPSPVRLVELGPGRGTLMADALRATRVMAGFAAAVDIHLVEISPALRAEQRERLGTSRMQWHDELATVPEGALLLIANEFFDALPIHQFQCTPAGWRERLVAAAPGSSGKELAFVLSPDATPATALIPAALATAPLDSIAEVCPVAISLAQEVGKRVATAGVAALIVDFGHTATAAGDTLQAVRRHESQHVLASPGDADLTAHIDFAAVARAGREAGAAVFGPVVQGEFLRRLGIEARAECLRTTASARQADDIARALERLTAPDQMGKLFKALAVTHPEIPVPAGFEGQRVNVVDSSM